MTNAQFADDEKGSPFFLRCCAEAGTTPTKRQASKFRNQYGKAHAVKEIVRKADAERAKRQKQANAA